MISLWDEQENNTLRIDLWTKDMLVDDMKNFYYQSLMTMADTFERAVGEADLAGEIRQFGQQLGEKMGLVQKVD